MHSPKHNFFFFPDAKQDLWTQFWFQAYKTLGWATLSRTVRSEVQNFALKNYYFFFCLKVRIKWISRNFYILISVWSHLPRIWYIWYVLIVHSRYYSFLCVGCVNRMCMSIRARAGRLLEILISNSCTKRFSTNHWTMFSYYTYLIQWPTGFRV